MVLSLFNSAKTGNIVKSVELPQQNLRPYPLRFDRSAQEKDRNIMYVLIDVPWRSLLQPLSYQETLSVGK